MSKRIYLLTAPFDENAKTGDGQYAQTLEYSLKEFYPQLNVKWLKYTDHDYVIPSPVGANSLPVSTIPSAITLQPVANGKTFLTGYQLLDIENKEAFSLCQKILESTTSPRTPKMLVAHTGHLHSLYLQDIYRQALLVLDAKKIDNEIQHLDNKNDAIKIFVQDKEIVEIQKTQKKSRYKSLSEFYNKYVLHGYPVNRYFSLNEAFEAVFFKQKFDVRLRLAKENLKAMADMFKKHTLDAEELITISNNLSGVNSFPYDFYTRHLTYDVTESHVKNFYDVNSIKMLLTSVLNGSREYLDQINTIRQILKDKLPDTFQYSAIKFDEKQAAIIMGLLYKYRADWDKHNKFPAPTEKAFEYKFWNYIKEEILNVNIELIKNKIKCLTKLSKDFEKSKDQITPDITGKLQALIKEPHMGCFELMNQLPSFYKKHKISAKEGFVLAYEANQRDPVKALFIESLIKRMKVASHDLPDPAKGDVYLDIHIRPPDCGVFITATDIRALKIAGIHVNLTIHEYKQNYTRRYLQQFTHELMSVADSVSFFNACDMNSAILASTHGDCDKRNTMTEEGAAKKRREVGADFPLVSYPVAKYDLASKSGLTVASQLLTSEPPHPFSILQRRPDILSFGTIRPGKGFEEALQLAQQLKEKSADINARIRTVPIIKVAGDPQDEGLMQQLVEERFGRSIVLLVQRVKPYQIAFTSKQKRDYWKALVAWLNGMPGIIVSNPHLELYPWCEREELARLKSSCKYVFRVDDMGMRRNGSAIISVLDVGIVYAKFGSVTDEIFYGKGEYADAVDIGQERYGVYNLHSLEEKIRKSQRLDEDSPIPPLLGYHSLTLKKMKKIDPDSPYKRKSGSRSPKDVLESIIARELNQLTHMRENNLDRSDNYKTVLQAQRLLKELFTLRNAADCLLKRIGLEKMPHYRELPRVGCETKLTAHVSEFSGSQTSTGCDIIKPILSKSGHCRSSSFTFFGGEKKCINAQYVRRSRSFSR